MQTAFRTVERPHWANSGGPQSRTRNERISSTILGRKDGPIHCPRHLCLALDFGTDDPVTVTTRLLAEAGLKDPESLRHLFGRDLRPMVCQLTPYLQSLTVAGADPMEVLRQAFLLGLCTSVRFDPGRPVLWTQASLARRLELFDVTEFYA